MVHVRIALVAFLVLVSLFVHGQEPAATILAYHSQIYLRKDNLVREESISIQVNKSEGDHYVAWSLTYEKGDQLQIFEAETYDAQGRLVRTLKKNDIVDRSAFSDVSFYDEGMVKEFELKWHQYPYRVELSFRHSYAKYLNLVAWYPVIFSEVPVIKAHLTTRFPVNLPTRQTYDTAFTHQTDTLNDEVVQTWILNDILVKKAQMWSPPIEEGVPSVKIVPLLFTFGKPGSLASWQSYGQWHWQLNLERDELTPSEKRRLDDLLAGESDALEKIKKVYRYLQKNTRYINISMDIGGMQPHEASYVCENKYGDCKALTNYMKAVLNYIGIEAYYVPVFANENPIKIDVDFPSQQFNHVILCVPVGQDTIWLENTSDITPPGYLGVFTQDRWGLLVDDQKSHLVYIPALNIDDVKNENSYEILLHPEDNQSEMTMSQVARASDFEYIQSIRNQVNAKNWQKYLVDQIPFENLLVHDFAFNDFDDQPIVELTMSASLQNYFRKMGNMWVASVPEITTFQLERPQDRYSDIRINYPTYIVDTVRYVIKGSENMEIRIPESYTLESPFGHYHGHYWIEDNVAIFAREYLLKAGNYSLRQYPDFYQFTSLLSDHFSNLKIILKK